MLHSFRCAFLDTDVQNTLPSPHSQFIKYLRNGVYFRNTLSAIGSNRQSVVGPELDKSNVVERLQLHAEFKLVTLSLLD